MDDDSASNSQCDSAGGLPEFTLRVRQTNGTIIEHSVASRALSVASLKQALSERTEIPVERMRLMLESTILADDNSLESYGKYNIHDGSVLRLVQLAGNHVQSHPQNVNGITSAPPAPPSSAQAMTNQARQVSCDIRPSYTLHWAVFRLSSHAEHASLVPLRLLSPRVTLHPCVVLSRSPPAPRMAH
ncbi:hypothetical protein GGI04_003888 [Coemansia thaxteri]|nr:hypothetical protein GGI04_003888 [Coemansia thaxteri]